jgi:MFS family permease
VTGGSRRQALITLCVTEIVSYGVVYYAFPVLAAGIVSDTGWSRTAVTAAFSAGNLAGALAGIPAGRVLHRHGPRPVMTAASVLGAASVAGVAAAPSYGWFLIAWLAAGVAMAGLFYPPAFAALTAWYGPRRVHALTALTLAAGFASTIFAPLTAALAGHMSWRGVYFVLAAALAVITIPAHALGLRLPWTAQPADHVAVRIPDRQVLASRTFLLLVMAATLSAFALYAAVVNLVPLLTGRGMSPALAAWALGLGGAGQVAGRLCYRALAARLHVRGRTVAVIAAGAAVILLLGLLPGPAALLVVVSVITGAVRGVFTLVQATLVSDHWGPDRYAALNGVFSAPLTAATALAPSIGAAIASATGSYPALFVILAAAATAGAALAAAAPARGADATAQAGDLTAAPSPAYGDQGSTGTPEVREQPPGAARSARRDGLAQSPPRRSCRGHRPGPGRGPTSAPPQPGPVLRGPGRTP